MRNFVIAAAMAATVFVIGGCDKMGQLGPAGPQGSQGSQGEKGDKGDPPELTVGDDCKFDADCDEDGKCTEAGFCRWTSNDEITTSVRKRREQELETAKETATRRKEEQLNAEKTCASSRGADCMLADDAKRHAQAADTVVKHAEGQLALVTPPAPTTEPPKAGTAVAKADDKAGGKKDEKSAGKKSPAAKPSGSAKSSDIEDLKTDVVLLTSRVDNVEGRVGGIEDNQKSLFGKTGELVVAVGALGRKIEAKREVAPVKPSADPIFNYRRFNACVKAREPDIFVGEGLSAEERKTKIENDCRAHEAG